MRRVIPRAFFNPLSLFGAGLSFLSLAIIIFLILFEAVSGGETPPYSGILTLVVIPGFLVLGLFIVLLGMLWERRRVRRGGTERSRYPQIDFNDPRQRAVFAFVIAIIVVFVLASVLGAYNAYEYTESTEFCGLACHSVMKPQHVSFQHSPHARIMCVNCHVGEGAGRYIQSKLLGVRQLFLLARGNYPRPIDTPVKNMLPARDTCERCHWSRHFQGSQLKTINYFLPDEQNSPWSTVLLMRIGGGESSEMGPTSGIHWHMNLEHEVSYVATDPDRQVIPWIRSKARDGKVTEYLSKDSELTTERIESAPKRRMDCMDCHNRPSHVFRSANEAVNEFMSLGLIDPKLPSAKSISVEALEQPYTTEKEALKGIGEFVRQKYAEGYPQLSPEQKAAMERAILELQTIYSRNYFPEMKVSWKTYPDHIGHFTSPGCFRCHDNNHVSKDGKVLSRDCNLCHTIMAQGPDISQAPPVPQPLPFEHPEDIGEMWMESNCSDCHGPAE
ncbi:MAG: NapC/NirT family cytochrome c [Acidobacteria bacterium]|nr:NapC/NirT family cytochrome c [Acidobacteriota bacterium]